MPTLTMNLRSTLVRWRLNTGKAIFQTRFFCQCSVTKKKDLNFPMQTSCAIEEIEKGWYEWWESKGFFRKNGSEKVFNMILPPPNVTGKLHMGHALTCSIQDAIIRWKQMNGYEVIWIPGCDHAGIATQVVVEKHLMQTKNVTRHQLGRDEFLKEVHEWKDEKGTIIYQQMKRMGIAIDWNKSTFTMDPKICIAVNKAIEQLYESGLLYRSHMMVNWCCSLQSVISDAEVEYLSINGPTNIKVPNHDSPVTFGNIFNIGYQLQNSNEIVVVCTTRPETIFGDTALMIHPDDQRYIHLHGKFVCHPFSNELLPIITDKEVNMEVGTGIVKVTPGHSFQDYEVGKRHNLKKLIIMDDKGCMIGVPDVQGMPRFKAREWVLSNLASRGLYKGKSDHALQLPLCSRSGDVIEPSLKLQWFIKMKSLSEAALNSVQSGELSIFPEQYKKVWELFLSADKDWCISRQLWWGHRMPIYWVSTICKSVYGDDQELNKKTSIFVPASSDQEAVAKGALKLGVSPSEIQFISQETDVLDTWFSSGLLPFAVFGWPESTKDYQKYYPLSLLETGHDIIYFWVARMVMLGMHFTKQLPFKKVLLHSLVCDAEGHKMSKSKGNTIDPMEIMDGNTKTNDEKVQKIPVCGTDALRFSLCSYDIKNWNISLDMTTIEQNNLFRNKMWQTVRFIIQNLHKIPDGDQHMKIIDLDRVDNLMDAWLLSRLSEMIFKVNNGFNNYELHEATRALKTFWYTYLCDIYLEAVKPRLWNSSDLASAHRALSTLYTSCHTTLLVLAPFMPFISEELYQRLPSSEVKCDSIMECSAPLHEQWKNFRNQRLEEHILQLVEVTSAFRNLRKDIDLRAKSGGTGNLYIENPELREVADSLKGELARMSFLSEIIILQNKPIHSELSAVISHVTPGISVHLLLQDLIDPQKEMVRIQSIILSLEKRKQKRELKVARSQLSSIEAGEKNLKILEEINGKIRQYEELLEKVKGIR